jgi:hypothetical protein
MTETDNQPEKHDGAAPARVYEKRWWMWGLAVATLVLTADLRSRLGRPWDAWVLLEAVAAAVALAVTCGKWRGKVVSGFLAIGAAMCVLKAVQVAWQG